MDEGDGKERGVYILPEQMRKKEEDWGLTKKNEMI